MRRKGTVKNSHATWGATERLFAALLRQCTFSPGGFIEKGTRWSDLPHVGLRPEPLPSER